jgi:small-conductance mechanosensitive channel
MNAEAMDFQQLLTFIAWGRVPFAFLIFAVGWVGLVLSGRFFDDLAERFTERRLILKKVKALTRFILYVTIAVLIGTSILDVHSTALVAILGSIGLAMGFAFKDLLASLMAGIILLIDEPFQVGDRVSFGGYYGEVTEIRLRSVRLVTLDDNLVTIPNSKFLSDAVASANAGALDCMVVIPFYIAAAEDFYEARRIVSEAAATSRYVYIDKPIVTLIRDEFLGERFVTVIRVKAYVFDARYESSFASDVTERVKRAFREAGIWTPDQQYRDLDLHGREVGRQHSR